MNKKLLMGSALGLVALGAGALAMVSFGGSDSGESPAVARSARAESLGSSHDPFVFAPELGAFADFNFKTGKVVKLPSPVTPAPSKNDQAPTTSGGSTTTQPDDEAANEDPNDAPGGDANGGQDAGTDPAKPKIPFNPQVNDALCEALGACDEPQLPYNPDLNDALCEALGTCDEPELPYNPDLNDALCGALGTCDDNPVIDPPVNIFGDDEDSSGRLPNPCALFGTCDDDEPTLPIKDWGIGDGISMRSRG